MKKYTFIAVLLMLLAGTAYGQEEANVFQPTVRLGYQFIREQTRPVDGPAEIAYRGLDHAIRLEADLWQVAPRLSLGLHLAVDKARYNYDGSDPDDIYDSKRTFGLHYGLNANYHLLGSQRHWDLTMGGQIGSFWCYGISPQMEYSATLTATYYPFRSLGIYAQMGWGKYVYCNNVIPLLEYGSTSLTLGFSYRF